ncbi:MAG: type ISP restriction/modification enzyme [Rubrivivax sp.]
MDLHIGHEQVEPWPLQRQDTPDEKARAAGQAPKCLLKSEPEPGRIVIDSETTLSGVPAEAWAYRLGNRSAIDWVLDQHKERKPKDPTIRAKFDTYRFAGHKERVIGLLARVVRVSVQTMRLVAELQAGPR